MFRVWGLVLRDCKVMYGRGFLVEGFRSCTVVKGTGADRAY